jgi:hypothetical protein
MRRILTKPLIEVLFKQAVSTWFDEDITLLQHVTSVFANAGFPISIRVGFQDVNDEDEIRFSLQSSLASAA